MVVQIRNYFSAFAAGGILACAIFSPRVALIFAAPAALGVMFALTILAERKKRRRLLMEMFHLRDTTEKLTREAKVAENPSAGQLEEPLPTSGSFTEPEPDADVCLRAKVISLR